MERRGVTRAAAADIRGHRGARPGRRRPRIPLRCASRGARGWEGRRSGSGDRGRPSGGRRPGARKPRSARSSRRRHQPRPVRDDRPGRRVGAARSGLGRRAEPGAVAGEGSGSLPDPDGGGRRRCRARRDQPELDPGRGGDGDQPRPAAGHGGVHRSRRSVDGDSWGEEWGRSCSVSPSRGRWPRRSRSSLRAADLLPSGFTPARGPGGADARQRDDDHRRVRRRARRRCSRSRPGRARPSASRSR